jgi:methyl-accepting chemotaxis protein
MITKFKVSGNAVEQFINAVKSLAADANMLSNAAVEGKLGTRADASKHNGEFGKIVQGVNRTIDSLVGLIDAMPMPAMIIDKNLNIRYMNTAGLSLGKTTLDRLAGTPCSQYFKTGDCETGMCACKRALDEGIPCNSSTIARPTTDLSLEIDYTGVPIKSETGEIVGIFEFAIDQTAIRNAQKKAQKLSDYQTHEVSKVQTNLEKIARGELAIELKTEEPDSDTVEAKRTFDTINTAISGVVTSIGSLVSDAGMLSKAAVEGKLATRADASKHQGDYRKVVHGVNNTLDAVITPINEAQSVLEKVARRDLTARMCGNYNGDMAKIKNAINSAVDNIDKALLQVTEATVQVTSASGQISSGSQSLAQGTNEQASSLEEVSSSLVEMESKTKQNADNANQAKLLAGESDTNAKSGAEAMYMMSSAINRIKESSDQTAKIVKTIDEIAMQTNLLALNAAVEAARAGEAGRGFAVVAEEVRNLAQRSAQAAKNTADMITESVKNADDGVKIATEVSQSFETIASSAKKVNDLIAEIAAASQEQSAGIEQINTAVAQMDKVTQQNAANSEESASAAEELSSQAEELKNMISQFTLSHNT